MELFCYTIDCIAHICFLHTKMRGFMGNIFMESLLLFQSQPRLVFLQRLAWTIYEALMEKASLSLRRCNSLLPAQGPQM